MAEKTTGTKNQDISKHSQVNENPGGDGYDKGQEIKESGAESETQAIPKRNQENLQNRGFQEDQPKNPVRGSGSLKQEDQEDKYRQPGDKFSEDGDKISS